LCLQVYKEGLDKRATYQKEEGWEEIKISEGRNGELGQAQAIQTKSKEKGGLLQNINQIEEKMTKDPLVICLKFIKRKQNSTKKGSRGHFS
jgi:hypothetical protein